MKKIPVIPTKQCVLCGKTFSRRKASGGLYHAPRWAAKQCCSNTCHMQNMWNLRREDVRERFWRQVHKRTATECWLWAGGMRDPKKGYGGFHLEKKKMVRAHRMAYILTHGPIPSGLVVRHRCDNPPCCNPEHLVLGTTADNTRDRDERARGVWVSPKPGHLTPREVKDMLLRFARWGKTTQAAKELAKEFGLKSSQFWAYTRQSLDQKPIVP